MDDGEYASVTLVASLVLALIVLQGFELKKRFIVVSKEGLMPQQVAVLKN